MRLFDDIIDHLQNFILQREAGSRRYRRDSINPFNWPPAGKRDIILKQDVGVELGSPMDDSVSFLVWTDNPSLVNDNLITLIGPDIHECAEGHLPFGKAVIISGSFNEQNAYERYRDMMLVRYDVSLRGFMMRSSSQFMREWSRVSRDALAEGFSLPLLGSALIERYREKSYIKGVEILMVTSSVEDVRALKEMGNVAMQYISAIRKMEEELSFDCDTCDYQPVCGEVPDLKKMREALITSKKRKFSH